MEQTILTARSPNRFVELLRYSFKLQCTDTLKLVTQWTEFALFKRVAKGSNRRGPSSLFFI